jgi:multiple sugar transport system permease protein
MAKIKSEKSILFAIPAIILYASFMIGPLAAMFYISTLKWTYIIAPPSFLGLDNYRNMFESDAFWTALKNTIVLVTTLLPIMIPLAFMVGYYLAHPDVYSRFDFYECNSHGLFCSSHSPRST